MTAGLEVRVYDDDDRHFTVVALKNERTVGHINVFCSPGRPGLWLVDSIEAEHKRAGIGTMLYEAAARESARRGGRLASFDRVSEASEGFWQKQQRRGRADVVETVGHGHDIIALRPGIDDLSNNPSERPRGFPWPKDARVYHATTALHAVLNEGFKTRRQRGGTHALGGGTDAAVSFTLDQRTARSIALGLSVIRRIAHGEVQLGDLILQLDDVAPSVLKQIQEHLASEMGVRTPEDVMRVDNGRRWIRRYSPLISTKQREQLARMGAFEDEIETGAWVDAHALATVTDDERTWDELWQYRSDIVNAYKAMLFTGGWDRALYNPLFFNTNLAALANIDDSDIGIVSAKLGANWVCAEYDSAKQLGYEPPQNVAPSTLTQWAQGCEAELDRGRFHEPAPRLREEYRSTLPRDWDPPDPSDTLVYLGSMAELRVWNLHLIQNVGAFETLDEVINEARDAWDGKGHAIDDPYWVPWHKDQPTYAFTSLVR